MLVHLSMSPKVQDESPQSVEEEELLPGGFSENVGAESRSGPQGWSSSWLSPPSSC